MNYVLDFFSGFSTAILFALWFISIINYKKLPETIPTHFDIEGKPDGFGPRYFIFLLPIVGTLIFAFLNFPKSFSHFPVTLTPENQEVQILIGKLVAKSIISYCLLLFFFSTKFCIRYVEKKAPQKGFPILPWIGGLFAIIFFFIILANIYK